MSWKNRFDWPFPVDFLAGQKYLANVLHKTIKRFFLLGDRVTFVRFLETTSAFVAIVKRMVAAVWCVYPLSVKVRLISITVTYFKKRQ